MSDSSDNRPKKTMFLMIYVGLALFGTLMAIGSYWSAVTPDWRKPAIVLGVIGFSRRLVPAAFASKAKLRAD